MITPNFWDDNKIYYRPKSWGERMPLALLRLLTGQE